MKLLTNKQKQEIEQELVSDNQATIVRFLHNGQNVNISTGELLPKGTNVIHQVVYWNFTKDTAKKIAKWMDIKPVFSE